jgi:methylthioribose-1-phosphate isomerase
MELLVRPVYFESDTLFVLDQTLLPDGEVYLEIRDLEQAVSAIKELKVRGAPAIGVAAAYSFLLGIKDYLDLSGDAFLKKAKEVKEILESARPTAVNLFWSVQRMYSKLEHLLKAGEDAFKIYSALKDEADSIFKEDLEASLRIFENFLSLVPENIALSVLTHCNTGALATAGLGTALGVIRALYERGKLKFVYATETRPLFQGARLTAWELEKYGIPYNVITDSSAAYVLFQRKIDAIIVGADRVAANYDTANKIGTLSLALAAAYYKIPFFVVCPETTFDPSTRNGQEIQIELRSGTEIGVIAGKKIVPDPEKCFNPAFDVTPASLITAIITDKRIICIKEIPW